MTFDLEIPNDDELLAGGSMTLENDAISILDQRKRELDAAVSYGDWESILTKCPVRESNALATISTTPGFPNREEYQKAVRQLLATDESALAATRELFHDLHERLNA